MEEDYRLKQEAQAKEEDDGRRSRPLTTASKRPQSKRVRRSILQQVMCLSMGAGSRCSSHLRDGQDDTLCETKRVHIRAPLNRAHVAATGGGWCG